MGPAATMIFIALCGLSWYTLIYFEHIFGYSHAVNELNQTFIYPLTYYVNFYKYTILYILLWINAITKRSTLVVGLILIPFLDAAIAQSYGYNTYGAKERFAFLRFRRFR